MTVVYQGQTYSTQGAVREVLRNLGRASIRQIREILGLTDKSGSNRVYRAISDLQRSGEAERVLEGIYRYKEPQHKVPKTLGKIWRAVRCSQQFTVSDIVLLTGANRDYVNQYIRHLRKEGYIVFTDKRKGMQPVYRITTKATPGVPPYSKKQRIKQDDSWQQLEEAIWEMVRAVVTVNGQPKYVTVHIVRDKAKQILGLTTEGTENK